VKKTSKPSTKPASKSSSKKPAQNKPAAKKSPAKPKRKADGQSELLEIVARLALITEQLAETAERLAKLATQPPHAEQHRRDVPQTTDGASPELRAPAVDLTAPGENVADLTAPALDLEVDDATEDE
jgi:hypothetical protein